MRNPILDLVEKKNLRTDYPHFRAGDTVRVHWKIREDGKERVQVFEGVVISKSRRNNRSSFTVRKDSYGIAVERIFPVNSPRYEKIEVIASGDVRRAKVYYIRERRGKAARIPMLREVRPESKRPSSG